MKQTGESESPVDAIDRYLTEAADAGEADAAVFARCDAVMALIPKLADSPDVAWAYEEARRLARAAPASTARSASPPWFRNPALAWSAAGVLAVALVVTSLPPKLATDDPTDAAVTAPPAPQVANITFAPIVISTELAQRLAEIDPVVLLANETSVDSRSLAVLPFAEATRNQALSREAATMADSIYAQVFRQLSAVPGIIVIDAATAAIYADSDLTPEEIALQLGVRSIIEGRVGSVNGDIRFELRLTDAASAGSSIDESIERPQEELAMLQTDIASSVIGALARTRRVPQSDEAP
jgi:TolB-like protein